MKALFTTILILLAIWSSYAADAGSRELFNAPQDHASVLRRMNLSEFINRLFFKGVGEKYPAKRDTFGNAICIWKVCSFQRETKKKNRQRTAKKPSQQEIEMLKQILNRGRYFESQIAL